MAFRCGNCGGYYSQTEVTNAKPPRHPWPLTARGQQLLAQHDATGATRPQCPGCGQPTLIAR